jgi:hypothetical protein
MASRISHFFLLEMVKMEGAMSSGFKPNSYGALLKASFSIVASGDLYHRVEKKYISSSVQGFARPTHPINI